MSRITQFQLDLNGDLAFGLCDLGMGEPGLGYVSLTEMRSVRGHLKLPVERDLHFEADKTISFYAAEARERGDIAARHRDRSPPARRPTIFTPTTD